MKILGVDYGDVRTGVSVCDKSELLASPVGVIHEKNFAKVVKEIVRIAEENKVEEIVIGNPKNMDGSEGSRSQLCQKLAKEVEEHSQGIGVKLWDERQTTVQATTYLNQTNVRGKKRKNVIDAVAATIILENYLDYRAKAKNSTS